MTFLTINTKMAICNSLGGTEGATQSPPPPLPATGSVPGEGQPVLSPTVSPRRGSLPRERRPVLSEITLHPCEADEQKSKGAGGGGIAVKSEDTGRAWGPSPDFSTKQRSPQTHSLCPWQAAAGGRGSMLWGDPGSPAPQLSTRKTFIGLWGEIQDPHHVRLAFSKQPTPHASGGFTCPAARCWGTALSALMRRWGGGLPGLVGDRERSPSGGEGPTSRPVSRQRSAGVSREGVRYEFNFGAEGSVPGGDALGLHREERRPGGSCRYAARLPERGGAGNARLG